MKEIMTLGQDLVSVVVWTRKPPHLRHLDAWAPGDGAVWCGLGGAALLRKRFSGGFEMQVLEPFPHHAIDLELAAEVTHSRMHSDPFLL